MSVITRLYCSFVSAFLLVGFLGHAIQAQSIDFNALSERAYRSAILDKSLEIEYVLEEVGIQDFQKQGIADHVQEFRSNVIDSIVSNSRNQANYASMQTRLFDEIENELLPEQVEQLRKLFLQRFFLMRTDETFDLPVVMAGELGLKKDAIKSLRESYETTKKEFCVERDSAKQVAWKEIKNLLPDEVCSEVTKVLDELHKHKNSGATSTSDVVATRYWTTEDFDQFEKKLTYQLIFNIRVEPAYQQQFEVTEFQVQEMNEFIKILRKREVEFNEKSKVEMRDVANRTKSDRNTELYHAQKRVEQQKIDLYYDFTMDMAQTCLTPKQVEWIEKIAEWKRMVWESRFGDDFGIPVAICRIADVEKAKTEQLSVGIDEVRKRYYERLGKLRRTSFDRVYGHLPEKEKTKYRSLFGSYYDYNAERVATWDKLRK